jgi:hypothetical protein
LGRRWRILKKEWGQRKKTPTSIRPVDKLMDHRFSKLQP